MSVQLGSTSVHGEYIARAEVDGADPIVITGFSHRGKSLRPVRVKAIWANADSQSWTLYKLVVFGSVLRKDGTLGQVPAGMEWGASVLAADISTAPAWALEWMDSIQLPVLPGAES